MNDELMQTRRISVDGITLREQADGDGLTLAGIAVPFGTEYELFDGYREVIDPDCDFGERNDGITLREQADGDGLTLAGIAVPFGTEYELFDGYREVIDPDCDFGERNVKLAREHGELIGRITEQAREPDGLTACTSPLASRTPHRAVKSPTSYAKASTTLSASDSNPSRTPSNSVTTA